MSYIASEAEIMLNNLIPYLQYQYSEEVLQYFTKEAKWNAKDDSWDKETKRMVCLTDKYIEEEEEEELGLE